MRSIRPTLVVSTLVVIAVASSCGGNGGNTTSAAATGTGGSTGETTSGGGHGGAGGSGGATTSTGTTTTGVGGGTTSTGIGGATSTGTGTGGTPCAVGTIECMGTTKQVCDGNGGFTGVVDCATMNQVCAPNLGCVNCIPGTGTCNGNVGTYCLQDGTGNATETCDSVQGTTCNPSTGRCDGPCGLVALGKSYIGCDYFPTVTANMVDDSTFHFAVAVSNTTALPANVTVTQGVATIANVMVPAASVQVIQLPWNTTLKGPYSPFVIAFPASVLVKQGAYRLRSTQPVTVYQFNPIEYTLNGQFSYTNDASLLLPVTAWTGTYRTVARHHFFATSGFYAITAKDDNTVVTVLAGANGVKVKGGVPGINGNGNGSVTLNAGDVAEIVTNGANNANDPNDVTGTLVTATNPVQVIAGHQCVYIPDDVAACDHLEESMFPYETLATDYIVTAPLIPTGGMTPKVEMVRVVATQDNTTLTYDPPQAGAPGAIAKAGGWIELADNPNHFKISANNPILVAQYMEGQEAGGGSGDPAMTLAVTTSQFRSSYLFHAPVNYESSYVNIVAPTGAAVTLDGQAVPAGSFQTIGGSGYSVSLQSISNAGNGNHNITSPMPFGISVYGYGQYTSYWYPGGSDLTVLHQ
jgi:IgGFc binding protein